MDIESINSLSVSEVPKDTIRPLWSIVIPTYNCAHYLKETIESVLKNGLSEDDMEIIVIDDNSDKDDPKKVVDQFGRGRVKFHQQEKNVGKGRNYGTGLQMTKGHFIHLLHGDDTVENGFYKKIESLFDKNSEASAAFCRCNYINAESNIIGETSLISKDEGLVSDFLIKIATWQLIQPPSIVFKRKVYETLGTYDLRLKYIEDWEFYVRAAVKFKYVYTPEIYANYRIFSQNSSSQSIKGGKRVATIAQVFSIIDDYLPHEVKRKVEAERDNASAVYLLNFIPKLMADKDFKGLFVVTKAFCRYNKKLRLWGRWFRFVTQYPKFNKR